MLGKLLDYFRTGPDRPVALEGKALARFYERKRWSVFLSVTLGYGLFYTCRINFSVAKKPMLDADVLSAAQMGYIGTALLAVYAVGKFANGFLADRANIRRFLATGLLLSALVNLVLGSTGLFALFVLLWGLNGWFQSTGSAPCVVALTQWFSAKERGTRYGVWSMSHSIGEALTFAVTAVLVSHLGWRWGFWGPGLLCVAGALVLLRTLADRPETYGLPAVAAWRNDGSPLPKPKEPVGRAQLEVLRMPAVWILGLASASIYIARYAINSWGPLFLQEAKGYGLIEAGALLSLCPIAGLAGSVASGFVSDRFFGSRRNGPALIFGVIQIASFAALYLIPPGHLWLDRLALSVFGFAMGVLVVYLGGLMAVDICPPRAVGAAMGLVGMFSYVGAAVQDTVSGLLIDAGRRQATGLHAFDAAFLFWMIASAASLLLTLLIWNARPPAEPAAESVPGSLAPGV